MAMRVRRVCFCVVLFGLWGVAGAQGQNGSINGRVTDRSGADYPGVTVVLHNEATQTDLTTKTDESSRFRFTDVPIGIYTLRVEQEGYSVASRTRTLTVSGPGETLEANFDLAPGGVLEQVTVTAARGERDVMDVPVPVATLTERDIQKENPSGTGDALLNLPNVTPVASGPYLTRPSLRGLASNRVLIMVDGERLNNSRTFTDQSGVEVGLVDPGAIRSMEVVYGSGSVLYGTDALAGTINIITDQPQPADKKIHFGGSLNLFASSNEPGRRGSAKIDVAGRRFAFRGTGELERFPDYNSGGPFNESNIPLINAGVVMNTIFAPGVNDTFNAPFTRTSSEIPNSQEHGSDWGTELRYRLGKDQWLRVGYNRRHVSSAGFSDNTPPFLFSTILLPKSNFDKANMRYEAHGLRSWLPDFAVSGYWQDQNRVLRNIFTIRTAVPPMPGGPPFNSILDLDFFDDTGEDVKSFGYDVQASFLLGHHNILTAGTSLFRDHSRDNPFQLLNINIIGFATIPPAPPMFIPMLIPILQNNISFPQVVPISNFRNAGFFAQDEFDVTPWLRLIGGGRVDQFHVNSVNTPNYDPTLMGGISGAQPPIDLSALPTANGSTIDRTAVTGDFGVVVRPRSVFSVSARIGRSYRHPNLEELFFSGPGTIGQIAPNTKLKPETGLNFDLDLHVRTKRFGGTVGYFNNLYRNFISTQIISVSPTIGPISQAINFAKVRLQGIEGSMEIPVHAGSTQFTVFTNLSYLHGQVLNGFNFFTSTSIADTPADNITPFKIVPGLRWQDKEGRWWWEYAARVETHVNRASPVRLTSPFLTAEDLWGLNGFTVHSLKGGYSLFKGERSPVAITVGLENLGNKFYREQFVFGPARGRSLTVGLSLRYF